VKRKIVLLSGHEDGNLIVCLRMEGERSEKGPVEGGS